MTAARVGGAAILSGAVLLSLAYCATSDVRVEQGPSPSTSAVPIPAAKPATSVLPPEAPIRATLPSGVVVSIRPATTTSNGRLDVPDNTAVAGWWQGGSRVGDPFGSTLVAAHVDSVSRGLGPFAELLSVGRGDRIVLDSSHLTQEFTVESLRLVPQGPLADEEWLFAPTGPHRLTLVTCAPPYDRARGGYQNLAVVTATPVGPPTRGRGPMITASATPEGSGRGAPLGRLVVVGLLVIAVVFVTAVRQRQDDASQTARGGARSAQSPVPLMDGEAYVRSEVLSSGDLLVTHWIKSDRRVFRVRLAVPLVSGTQDVTAEQVRVTAGSSKAFGPRQIRSGTASEYSFVGATSLKIAYRLTNVIQRSSSAPGRALAPVTALNVSFVPASQHVTRAVFAPEVLSLACSSPTLTAPPEPCGTRGPDGEWTAELFGPEAGDQVIAQLTLG